MEVAEIMEHTGLVPLFYHPDPEVCEAVVHACYEGGARLLEFTDRGDGASTIFEKLLRYVRKHLPGLAIGVGSVTDGSAASRYLQMGADFIVTPAFREDVADICNRRKVLWIAGCGSLTEIGQAESLGAEIVKLFPASVYGPEFISAVRGPQPWTRIMPTGGVLAEEADLRAWFSAGAACVGLGSALISKKLLEEKDFRGIEDRVRDTLKTIGTLRSEVE
jgi:2-dehydro-3-deoxyphosphogluconate aldolase/(4S)-4-hydroxy-2-oxoglutarate aldolase